MEEILIPETSVGYTYQVSHGENYGAFQLGKQLVTTTFHKQSNKRSTAYPLSQIKWTELQNSSLHTIVPTSKPVVDINYPLLVETINKPMFIETHRLAEFNPRGTDVPVVLDLMIHDIDAILSVVKSKVKAVNASSVCVISDSPDITNARIEFENGCVANITASRISMKNMRKSRFFQKDAYISVDYLDKICEIVRMQDAPEVPGDFDMILQNAEGVKKQIYFDNPKVHPNNAILDELESFAVAIQNNTTPIVTLEDGTEALRVAYMIIDSMDK